MSKELIVIAVILGACLFPAIYWSPHHSCVRAVLGDKTANLTEAEAHLMCGRALNSH